MAYPEGFGQGAEANRIRHRDDEHNGDCVLWLSNDPHTAICINLRDEERNRFTVVQERELLLCHQNLCDSNKIIAQNGSFDTYHEWLRNGLRIRIWFDTLLAHHTLYPQLPHSLAFLVSQYTTHPFYKDEGKKWKEGGGI